jgi:hypothetical protein
MTPMGKDIPMNTIDCTDLKALLSPYLDGELDEQTRHLAERHVSQCTPCRKLVDQAERVDAMIAEDVLSRTPPGVSADFIGSVLSRTVYAEPSVSVGPNRWALWTGWTAAAAMFAMASFIWFNQTNVSAPTDLADQSSVAPASEQQSNQTTTTRHVAPSVRTVAYDPGFALESQTFEGPLPKAAFELPHARVASAQEADDRSSDRALRLPGQPLLTHVMGELRSTRDTWVEAAAMHTTQMAASMMNTHAEPTTLANQSQPKATSRRPSIDRDDADTLYAAAIVMHLLSGADLNSFADIEHVRRVVEVDNLLPRLSRARDHLQPIDRPAVLAAESVLTRVAHGPLDTRDVYMLRETVTSLNLSDELAEITARFDDASQM